MVAASRAFVCIRPATYEDELEAKVLHALYAGRENALENTVFGVLAPDGVTKITRTGRSPSRIYADAAEMAAHLKEVSARYPGNGKERPQALPYTLDVRRGLNVAACDELPLAVVAAKDAKQLEAIQEKVSAAAWSAHLVGRMRWASAIEPGALESIEGAGPGLLLVDPDPFGLAGEVLATLSLDASAEQLERGLSEALALHRPLAKDPRGHVRDGKRAGIEWEGEVPVTDPTSLERKRRD